MDEPKVFFILMYYIIVKLTQIKETEEVRPKNKKINRRDIGRRMYKCECD